MKWWGYWFSYWFGFVWVNGFLIELICELKNLKISLFTLKCFWKRFMFGIWDCCDHLWISFHENYCDWLVMHMIVVMIWKVVWADGVIPAGRFGGILWCDGFPGGRRRRGCVPVSIWEVHFYVLIGIGFACCIELCVLKCVL